MSAGKENRFLFQAQSPTPLRSSSHAYAGENRPKSHWKTAYGPSCPDLCKGKRDNRKRQHLP
ncbi:MAG: hypothetical protein V8T87_16905 [Victivallales bacterium]